MLEAAIEAGADNVESDAEGHEVTTTPESFFAVRDALEAEFGAPEEAKVDWRPNTTVALDEEQAVSVLKLLDVLDDDDDVQNVYANCDIPDAVMAKFWRRKGLSLDPSARDRPGLAVYRLGACWRPKATGCAIWPTG